MFHQVKRNIFTSLINSCTTSVQPFVITELFHPLLMAESLSQGWLVIWTFTCWKGVMPEPYIVGIEFERDHLSFSLWTHCLLGIPKYSTISCSTYELFAIFVPVAVHVLNKMHQELPQALKWFLPYMGDDFGFVWCHTANRLMTHIGYVLANSKFGNT